MPHSAPVSDAMLVAIPALIITSRASLLPASITGSCSGAARRRLIGAWRCSWYLAKSAAVRGLGTEEDDGISGLRGPGIWRKVCFMGSILLIIAYYVNISNILII